MCRHFVGTLSALCRVCAGSHNVHAGECVVLLARFDGTFQHTYDASAQRHQRIADRSPLSPEGCLLLFALRQSQHQPPALLLHRTKIPPGIKGQIAAAVAGYFDVIGLLTRWRGGATGKAFGLAINRSRVQILLEATLRNNLGQVVHTYEPLSPSSITWYRPKGDDALWLGR